MRTYFYFSYSEKKTNAIETENINLYINIAINIKSN